MCSRLRTVLLAGSAVLLLSPAGTASGQTVPIDQRLANATRISCTFSAVATGGWKNGKATVTSTPAAITVTFHNINVDESSAEADSTFGPSSIAVRYSRGYLHLIQMKGAGPLYTTTVIAKETTGGRLMAVHTRHEYADVDLPGFTSKPEMYLGDCAVQ